MEENNLNPLAATHLLQHTLRSFCIHQNSQWVYAVFWRILPRIFPPPKWESEVEVHDRSGNRRNWILAWEDGFCNFEATAAVMNSGESTPPSICGDDRCYRGLRPEVFFKMSHEIHNYGEGLIGKVAANHSHKWIYKGQNDEEKNSCAWHNLLDSQPRNWEAQFQSGLETIALIAVREGVLQLGAVHKLSEDMSYVMVVRKMLSYMENIPGFLLPHPSSSSSTNFKNVEAINGSKSNDSHINNGICHIHFPHHQPPAMKIAPSMASLEALLSKLPSVKPPPSSLHFVVEAEEEEDGHGGDGGIAGSAPPPPLFLSP